MPDRVWKIYKRYSYYSEFFDMVWLRHMLWPTIKRKSLIFDSYNCMKHRELGEGQPWPSRRSGHLYVGSGPTKTGVIRRLRQKICPEQCRPEQHKDWLYC